MLRSLLIISALLLASSWLVGDEPPTRATPATAAPPTEATPGDRLTGKTLAITIKSDPTYGIYLQETQLQTLGGKSFLVGTGVDSGVGEWTAGRRLWVAVDDISEIIEFESPADLQKSLEPAEPGPDA